MRIKTHFSFFDGVMFFSLILTTLAVSSLFSQQPIQDLAKQDQRISIEDILKIHEQEFTALSLSPNEKHVIVELGNADNPHSEYTIDLKRRVLWLIHLVDGAATRLTEPDIDAHSATWSTNGDKIAFVSWESGKGEIWLMNKDGSKKEQLTHDNFETLNPYDSTSIIWSPDGKSIIYAVFPKSKRRSFASHIWDKEQGFAPGANGIYVSAPDLQKKRMRTFQNPPGFICEIRALNIQTKESRKLAESSSQSVQILPEWSKEGTHFMIVEGKSLKEISMKTGEVQVLYEGIVTAVKRLDDQVFLAKIDQDIIDIGKLTDGQFLSFFSHKTTGFNFRIHSWSKDGSKIFGTTHEGATSYLVQIDLGREKIEYLTEKGMSVFNYFNRAAAISLNKGNSVIFPYEGPNQPVELWMKKPGKELRQITKFHDFLLTKTLPRVHMFTYKSDAWPIEAFLVLPVGYDASKPVPLLAYMHGGPEICVDASFSQINSARSQSAAYWMASHGYAVFIPNFRGSANYGKDFMNQLQDYNLTNVPHRDLMAGISHLIAEEIADPENLGIYGHSWGGFQTTWAISHTDRFKGALAAVGGGYDMLSQARARGMSLLVFPNRQGKADPMAMWNDPEAFQKFSPIEHVQKVKTPTLFIETGAEHSKDKSAMAFFHGLVHNGVEAYFVYYPAAYHTGGWNNHYKHDYLRRLLVWFDHCLKGKPLPEWFLENRPSQVHE